MNHTRNQNTAFIESCVQPAWIEDRKGCLFLSAGPCSCCQWTTSHDSQAEESANQPASSVVHCQGHHAESEALGGLEEFCSHEWTQRRCTRPTTNLLRADPQSHLVRGCDRRTLNRQFRCRVWSILWIPTAKSLNLAVQCTNVQTELYENVMLHYRNNWPSSWVSCPCEVINAALTHLRISGYFPPSQHQIIICVQSMLTPSFPLGGKGTSTCWNQSAISISLSCSRVVFMTLHCWNTVHSALLWNKRPKCSNFVKIGDVTQRPSLRFQLQPEVFHMLGQFKVKQGSDCWEQSSWHWPLCFN